VKCIDNVLGFLDTSITRLAATSPNEKLTVNMQPEDDEDDDLVIKLKGLDNKSAENKRLMREVVTLITA